MPISRATRRRRRTLTALAVAAVLAVAAMVFGVFVFTGTITTRQTQRAAVDPAQECGTVAGDWVAVLVDRTTAPDEWARSLTARSTPEVAQALTGVDRAALPAGRVESVNVATDAGSCDARVTTADRRVTAVTLTRDGPGWVVTGWGFPSGEGG